MPAFHADDSDTDARVFSPSCHLRDVVNKPEQVDSVLSNAELEAGQRKSERDL